MSFLTAMLPISAAAKVASNLISRINNKPEQTRFEQVLHQTLGARTVAEHDLDRDSALTPGEFPGETSLFALWDANGDGKLVEAEIDAGAKLWQRWNQLDSDGDHSLTMHELGTAGETFRSMDTDLDGIVSRAEYYRAYQRGGLA